MSFLPSDRRADLLRQLFNEVCNPKDWKAPIDKIVPSDMVSLYAEAIEFMTATTVTTEKVDFMCADRPDRQGWVRLLSVGYRNGPAGP